MTVMTTAMLFGVQGSVGVGLDHEDPELDSSAKPMQGDLASPADSASIIQASWDQPTLRLAVEVPQPLVSVQPKQATWDAAPSPVVVISCLVGLAVFSLILGFVTLPFEWFHRNSVNWRSRA